MHKIFLKVKIVLFLLFIFFPIIHLFSQCIADAGRDTAVCEPMGSDTLFLGGNPSAQNGNPPYSYSWTCDYWIGSLHFTASDFLDDTASSNPAVISPTPDTDSLIFTLTVTDNSGNICNDAIMVKFCKFVFTLQDKRAYINQGDTIQLYPGVGQGCPPLNFSWYPKYNLSNPDSDITLAWPDSTTYYHAVVTDSAGCIAYDETFEVYVTPASAENKTGDKKCSLKYSANSSVIQFDCNYQGAISLIIYNSAGKEIEQNSITNKKEISLDLAKGIYFYRIINEQQIIRQGKFILD